MPGIAEGHPNWRRKLAEPTRASSPRRAASSPRSPPLSRPKGAAPDAAASALAAPPPRATYRLQFHKDFTFDDAAAIVPYLARLGHQPRLCLADPQGAARLDARLRHRRPLGHQPGARRRGRVLPSLRRARARTASASCSTSCRTTWASAAPTTPGGSRCSNGASCRRAARAFDIDWERLGADAQAHHAVPRRALRRGARERRASNSPSMPTRGQLQRLALRAPLPGLPAQPIRSSSTGRSSRIGEIGTEAAASVLAASERLRSMGEETAGAQPASTRRRRC